MPRAVSDLLPCPKQCVWRTPTDVLWLKHNTRFGKAWMSTHMLHILPQPSNICFIDFAQITNQICQNFDSKQTATKHLTWQCVQTLQSWNRLEVPRRCDIFQHKVGIPDLVGLECDIKNTVILHFPHNILMTSWCWVYVAGSLPVPKIQTPQLWFAGTALFANCPFHSKTMDCSGQFDMCCKTIGVVFHILDKSVTLSAFTLHIVSSSANNWNLFSLLTCNVWQQVHVICSTFVNQICFRAWGKIREVIRATTYAWFACRTPECSCKLLCHIAAEPLAVKCFWCKNCVLKSIGV